MAELGIVLPNTAVVAGTTTVDELLELAEVADAAADWDYVWVGDSLLSVPRFESVVPVAACAARTGRVRFGIACLVSLGLRSPLVVAHQWASLDLLSQGRVTLVACTGPSAGPGVERELEAFGMTYATKV